MPAITLGLAEVEERLRVLRRRLNAVTVQHSVYVSLTVCIGVATALIVLGLRGSVSTFRAAAWTGAAVCIAAAGWGALAAWRCWLDVEATAHMADRRAGLTDRLVTLLDLRTRPRPARLAPVLVAQLLALSKQWQPQKIAPRRVPRSAFALVAALLALGCTAFIERRPPEPAATALAGPHAAGVLVSEGSPNGPFTQGVPGAHTAGGPSLPGVPPPGTLAGEHAVDGRGSTGAVPQDGSQQVGSSQGLRDEPGQLPSEMRDGSRGPGVGGTREQQPGALTALPDRLQEALRRAFHAEPLDKPQQLAARSDPSSRDPSRRGEDRQDNVDRQHNEARDAQKNSAKGQGSETGTERGAQKGQSNPKPAGSAAQRQDTTSPNQDFEGKSPAAGDGSSPGGLMDGKGQKVVVDPNAPKTFKLTITSFLHAMEQKGDQPRQAGKKMGTTGSASSGSATQVALNERQLNDDALRKAEIPPEYEDIVRRVYSLRGEQ